MKRKGARTILLGDREIQAIEKVLMLNEGFAGKKLDKKDHTLYSLRQLSRM